MAACGDDGTTNTSASPTTTAAATTTAAPTTTEAAAATTAAPTTAAPTTAAPTTAAPTTAPPAPDAPIPVGSSTGQWNNDTFGSTGAAVVEVGQTDNIMSVFLDLTDGFVLGEGIADGFSLDLPIDELAAGATVETAALGTLSITIADGQITVVGTNSPAGGIAGFTATGTITGTILSGTYEVQFDSGDPATGTFEFPIG